MDSSLSCLRACLDNEVDVCRIINTAPHKPVAVPIPARRGAQGALSPVMGKLPTIILVTGDPLFARVSL